MQSQWQHTTHDTTDKYIYARVCCRAIHNKERVQAVEEMNESKCFLAILMFTSVAAGSESASPSVTRDMGVCDMV
jgi:hypothetical protein